MRTVTVALAVSLALAACSRGGGSHGAAVSSKDAARLLVDRNWLDSWPQHQDDHLTVYRFVPSMGGGVFQDRTVFKGTFELFKFKPDGDRLRFAFPHTGEKLQATYKIERVKGPEPFDLKLTISPDPRGKGVYYGLTSDHGQDLDTLMAGRDSRGD